MAPLTFSDIEKLSIPILLDTVINGKSPWSVKNVMSIEVPVVEHKVPVLFVGILSTLIIPIVVIACRAVFTWAKVAKKNRKMD